MTETATVVHERKVLRTEPGRVGPVFYVQCACGWSDRKGTKKGANMAMVQHRINADD